MMGNRELFWSQCRGIGLNLELICATLRYFTFLQLHQCLSRLVRDFWGMSVLPSSKSMLLTCLIGNKKLLCTQCRGIRPHPSAAASLMVFHELRREPGVCSRVMVGVVIKNFCLFINVRTPVYLRCTLQESKLRLAGQYGRIWR